MQLCNFSQELSKPYLFQGNKYPAEVVCCKFLVRSPRLKKILAMLVKVPSGIQPMSNLYSMIDVNLFTLCIAAKLDVELWRWIVVTM